MSAKWIRSQQWDDEHLTGPAMAPVKWLLRAFSSIWLAVLLLVMVALYGIAASVPVGLLALVPTVLVYALTFVAALVVGAWAPTWGVWRAMRGSTIGGGGRFAVGLLMLVVLVPTAGWAWHEYLWPMLRYDEATHSGLRLFAGFVERYKSVQVRRLPILEMSELEFYAWWPLRVVLLAFVANLVIATIRRIEFSLPYVGVLTVHTGIVTIALGSIYYARWKEEGDTILMAGPVDPASGEPSPGRAETGFYDNTQVALWLSQGQSGWEQRRLVGVPRYNDYGLDALGLGAQSPVPTASDEGRTLDVRVPESPWAFEQWRRAGFERQGIDPRLRFRVVGYATYAELEEARVKTPWEAGEDEGGEWVQPAEMYLDAPDPRTGEVDAGPQKRYRFVPTSPRERVAIEGEDAAPGGLLAIEVTAGTREGMTDERWSALSAAVPLDSDEAKAAWREGGGRALVIDRPATGYHAVVPVKIGSTIDVPGGNDAEGNEVGGYRLEVTNLADRPPFPIITPGYENAKSSVAIVQVVEVRSPRSARRAEPPRTEAPKSYERWVYHRFPEISQDLSLTETNQRGMPMRTAPDPDLHIGYLDASIIQVYVDEPTDEHTVRAIVRLPMGQTARVVEGLKLGDAEGLTIVPGKAADDGTAGGGLRLVLGEREAGVERVALPRVVPAGLREKSGIGTHEHAALAVKVWIDGSDWWRVVWVPYSQYMGMAQITPATIVLPEELGGDTLQLLFGRVMHEIRGLALQLSDFAMIPYPHSDVPKDYRSDVLVYRTVRNEDGSFKRVFDGERSTSLNEPLLVRVPHVADEDAPVPIRWLGRVFSLVAPVQYKFSQAGWDSQGWMQSKAAAERGELKRPAARYTILGVGNNPGIYIIASGAVMMALGIPWAFYLKPIIVRQKKKKIQRQLAKEGKLPAKKAATHPNGTTQRTENTETISV